MIVLAGPSGSGKSRLAERIGLPVLRLDDFYKEGDDPSLPRLVDGVRTGEVDWDDPESWLVEDAVAALRVLCEEGRVEVPVYEIARNGRSGWHEVSLGAHHLFVAEGIFAQEVVPAARSLGLLAAAYCLRQHPLLTFWRRLTRDLREHRKPPLVLVRRGYALLRDQRRVVDHAVALGCDPVTPEEAIARVASLRSQARD